MRTSVTIGQIPTGWDIDANLAAIGEMLAQSRPDDVVLLPEGGTTPPERTENRLPPPGTGVGCFLPPDGRGE